MSTIEHCEFLTERLRIGPWHAIADSDEGLINAVISVMSEPVTRTLPPSWQGSYSRVRAESWIKERDSEGYTLMAVHRISKEAVGFMILFEEDRDDDGTDVRIGYMIAERFQGHGVASEIISGFVDWCRQQKVIRTLTGGVDQGNHASIRVLEKNGFVRIASETPELKYQRTLVNTYP